MTTCEPCALRANGNAAAAESLESFRAQRLLLMLLNGAEDAMKEVAAELGCYDCIWRLAARYLATTADCLVRMADGDANEAAKWIERGLLEDLDGPAPT